MKVFEAFIYQRITRQKHAYAYSENTSEKFINLLVKKIIR